MRLESADFSEGPTWRQWYGRMQVVDLAGIGAISASVVAAIGIPSAIIVGRWQMRAGIQAAEATYRAAVDAVRGTAEANHEQWRRTARRDAYVQLLLKASLAEQLTLPEGNADPERIAAADAALTEALHDVELAYYIVRLESGGVADQAQALADAALEYGKAKRLWADYLRANATVARAEDEIRQQAVSAVMTHYDAARDPHPKETGEVGSLSGATEAVHQALSRVPHMTDRGIAAIVEVNYGPFSPAARLRQLMEARDAFLTTAHADLSGEAQRGWEG